MRIKPLAFAILFLSPIVAHAREKEKSITCPSGQHWVRAYSTPAYRRADGTRVSGSHTSAHCQGNPTAYAQWKDRLKSGKSTAEWAKLEKERTWTDSEREKVYEAISKLPDLLTSEGTQSIYRAFKDLSNASNPASGDYGFITLYDHAFEKGQDLTRILAHEFAHELFRQIPDSERRDYALTNHWIIAQPRPGKFVFIPGRDNFVEEDGMESVTEDFANNIEYFLFDPKRLDSVTPEAAAWLRRKFGDKLKLMKGAR